VTGDPEAWREWWQAEDALHAYFQGKDNIVFHTVIWPTIMLGYGGGGELGAGTPLHLPDDVFATEYLTMEGRQFSTSRAHSIYLRDFLDRYDPDPLRYYLIAASPETQDADFTWADFVRRNNDELLANWGNLVNRTLTNAYRTFGAVPKPAALTTADQAVLDGVDRGFETIGAHIGAGRFRASLGEAMRLASTVNQYISDQAPWALVKTDEVRAATVLYVSLRAVDSLKTVFTPFLPHTSQRLHELLGHDDVIAGPVESREVDEDGEAHEILTGDYAGWAGRWEPSDLRPGQPLREPRPLFKKLDDAIVDEELERMRAGASE
jgi:methionyl-tRNA synthetase